MQLLAHCLVIVGTHTHTMLRNDVLPRAPEKLRKKLGVETALKNESDSHRENEGAE